MAMTSIQDLVNPKVMADMISAKIEKKIVVAPFAKVDDTLVGVAGDTIVVPSNITTINPYNNPLLLHLYLE